MSAIRFIPPDKCVHAVVGALTALPVLFLARWQHLPTVKVMSLALAAAAVLGVLIEVRQRQLNRAAVARGEAAGHEVSGADALATLGGGVAMAAAFGLGAQL